MTTAPSVRRTQEYMLNMGPAHPAMHGVIRIVLELEGEKVAGAEVEIGYLHRAFEKHSENVTWNEVIPWADRLNYVSPLINDVGYCMAVEKLFGLEVPERGQYIRVIISELSRVTDHLTNVAATAMELGAFTPFLYLMKAREVLYFSLDRLTGARVTNSYTRVGGVKGDMPDDFEPMVREAFAVVRASLSDTDKLLTANRIFYDRMRGIGVLDKETALAYGITGPMLRASGVPYDVRRAHPYLVYDRVPFEVPVGGAGDNYDRYLVRMAEMEQSLRIVERCFNDIPRGPVRVPGGPTLPAGRMQDLGKAGKTGSLWRDRAATDPTLEGTGRPERWAVCAPRRDVVLPPKEEVFDSIEGLMDHFELVMWDRGIRPPDGEVYSVVEGGNGELGFHVVSDGADQPYRVRCRPPCFFNTAALHRLITGYTVADIIPTFGSINMIAGELER